MLGWFAVPWELPCLPWEQAGRPSPPSHFIHWAVFRRRGREGETSSLCPGLETRAGPLPFHPRDACEVIPQPGRGPAAAPSRRLSLPVSAVPPSLRPGLTPIAPLCLARTENDFGVSGWRGKTLPWPPRFIWWHLVAAGVSRGERPAPLPALQLAMGTCGGSLSPPLSRLSHLIQGKLSGTLRACNLLVLLKPGPCFSSF